MTRTINIDGQPVEYELEYKKVKNMNLRIRKDGSIYVSVNRYVTRQQADAFVLKNAEFIKKARERIQKRRHVRHRDGHPVARPDAGLPEGPGSPLNALEQRAVGCLLSVEFQRRLIRYRFSMALR